MPTLLRGWREKSWREGLEPLTARRGLALWAWTARHPRLYRLGSRIAIAALRRLGRRGWVARLPLAGGWTDGRDFPRPEPQGFVTRYRKGER